MVTVLGGLAEFERHLILSRTNEGRVRAKAGGVRFGRKPKQTKHQRDEALARTAQGETLTAIARSYNVPHMTISRLAGVTFMQWEPTNFAQLTIRAGVGVWLRYAGDVTSLLRV